MILNSFANKAINFYLNLKPPENLPGEVSIMNPYSVKEVQRITTSFYRKFFNDDNKRFFIFGINPGRHGGGVTGIAFTDPIAMENKLGIQNNFAKKPELSCQFIYKLVEEYGGPDKFYLRFFITALFPLALIKNNKNYNYYDDPDLYIKLKPFILSSVKKQVEFGADERIAISLGKKNMIYLEEINDEINFFKEIIYLDHPRFIMQYKRKSLLNYLDKYLNILKSLG